MADDLEYRTSRKAVEKEEYEKLKTKKKFGQSKVTGLLWRIGSEARDDR